ncbi:substrate-binding domain-containing protein [Roseateles cellulosilyticus]|uniref:Substrate-binding domain-containing protein n=1 Tax=Pelomonas cellulosilytica TaxID=2906762 RepID=A0ABS8XX97_9BURK|nr:substrate-binding domain-containing protein [Pelomonas sp. P8]MCE4556583.1 substrate-binding domain-containing protein [Pelomonas sp. P8]
MQTLNGISSMATRTLVAELAQAHAQASGRAVAMHAAGGVDVVRRLRNGERFDVVVLADDALQALAREGWVGPVRAFADSAVAAAVPAGARAPVLASADDFRAAVLDATAIGYSTGPSGTALLALFQRWGLLDALRPRLVQAAPGVPVAALLARGEVSLGLQQRSELLGQPGITLLGDLPAEPAFTSRFGAALGQAAGPGAQALLDHLCSPDAAFTKRRHGMTEPS